MGADRQAGQVEDEGRREGRVAALPGGLEDHAGAEEAVEGDVVPGGLPVAEGRYVVDVDLALGGGAEGVGEDAFLAGVLRGGRRRVREGGSVAAAEQVGAGPGAYGEARCRNIGPRTERSRVCPVLPSRPAYGRPEDSASPASAGWCSPVDGVKLT
ncbi:hypothetical protein SHKM778_35130 [Streptomyces sp. KM77-8]|uniref:Uncharacterized protein n=1 Tax=Streptomyces haneummycinicus TaxID=3074435 RepID=A0AAT9HI05_9ACTN